LAFSSAVSIAFIGAPSMAWDSMRLPPPIQNRHGHDFLVLLGPAVQASAMARAPALDMTLMSLVALGSLAACFAGASAPAAERVIARVATASVLRLFQR